MNTQNKRSVGILIAVAVLLLIPVIGGFPWSRIDFVIAGLLLLGTGLAIEIALRLVKTTAYRVAVCVAILLVLFLVWTELAVGLFRTRFAGS
jgi:hypothetical protein